MSKEPKWWPTKELGVSYPQHVANKKYLRNKYPGMTGEEIVAKRKKRRSFLHWLVGGRE